MRMRKRGFTLIEIVLVLAIGIGIIIGGITFYGQSRFSGKLYDTTKLITTLALGLTQEGRRRGTYENFDGTLAYDLGLIPASSLDGTDIMHPFGSVIEVSSNNPFDSISLALFDLDEVACNRLFGPAGQSNGGVVESRSVEVIINGNSFNPATEEPTADMCETGTDNVVELVLR